MVDVSDPLDPTFISCYGGDGYVHDAQCVNYEGPDERYLRLRNEAMIKHATRFCQTRARYQVKTRVVEKILVKTSPFRQYTSSGPQSDAIIDTVARRFNFSIFLTFSV